MGCAVVVCHRSLMQGSISALLPVSLTQLHCCVEPAMNEQRLISTHHDHWWHTPSGQCLLDWEHAQCDLMLPNVFGYHAVQLGTPQLDALRNNRMPHRWLGLLSCPDDGLCETTQLTPRTRVFVTDVTALPFQDNSLDLIVLPHVLEQCINAHSALREVSRVLRAEGQLVVIGLNPFGLWAFKHVQTHLFAHVRAGLWSSSQSSSVVSTQSHIRPLMSHFLSHWRLLDWLKLLDFELNALHFGVYQPPINSVVWLERWSWMNRWGTQWWPIFGAVYWMSATKKVHGMRLLGPAWRTSFQPQSAASAISRSQTH